eukprot:TRINITY_DN70615_c0_g1_i1.p1 TRINITY_DN70615_c0_g1~~TRINITY_DN70615_c0_g1_i1.p1  ORF type:complete len:425 (-),score=42.86 TRINITY_DN70615_c0_g1_i1:60-1334(-)
MTKKKTPIFLVVVYVVTMLATGTLNTITTKIQFTLTSIGMDGKEEDFRKPWFGTFNMLFAMSLVLLVERVFSFLASCICGFQQTMSAQEEALMFCAPPSKLSRRQKIILVAYPAAFDLAATALACTGIMFIPASVWQMLRGATIIFATLFSITFLKKKMLCFNWIGVLICVVGVTIVGLASILGTESESGTQYKDTKLVVFGIVLTLLGQVVQAAQVIAEEYLMKDVDLPAVEIVGWEGIWGVLMMVLFIYPLLYVLPGPDHGHREDVFDTLVLFRNNSEIQLVVTLYLFSCGTFNLAGIAVTGALSGVHRMMLDASRTVVIWAFGLFVHYRVDSSSKFGEEWNSHSYLQLVGFFILLTGQAIYGEIIKIPGIQYPEPLEEKDVQIFASPTAELNMIMSPGSQLGERRRMKSRDDILSPPRSPC